MSYRPICPGSNKVFRWSATQLNDVAPASSASVQLARLPVNVPLAMAAVTATRRRAFRRPLTRIMPSVKPSDSRVVISEDKGKVIGFLVLVRCPGVFLTPVAASWNQETRHPVRLLLG